MLSLKQEFERHNVFQVSAAKLINICNGDVATDDIAEDLLNSARKGRELMETFISDRLIEKKTSFYKVLHKVNSKTFGNLYDVTVRAEKQQMVQIKADRNLFRRLIVSIESGREINLDKLLQKELSPVPPSLVTTDGTLRSTNKAQLSQILEEGNVTNALPDSNLPFCTIIDGMSLVYTIGKPNELKTFGELADIILRAITSNLKGNCTRVDVIFDQYNALSVKSGTRVKRGKGRRPVRRLVENRASKLPDNWQNFMSLIENKHDLVDFLCEEFAKVHTEHDQELIISGGFNDPMKVVSSDPEHDVTQLSSNHEEADTRIILHAQEAASRGYEKLVVIAKDTDILVLLLAHRDHIDTSEVWMKSGTSQKPKFVAVHNISLSENLRKSLIQFHALTGSDTTSQFSGIGKRSAWKIFCMDNNAQFLQELGGEHLSSPETRSSAESFVCKLYHPKTSMACIQTLRSSMFRTSKKVLESLPPTEDSLMLHIRRAHYQAFVWRHAHVAQINLPSPLLSGWKEDNGAYIPILMGQEAVPANYLQLTTCGCTQSGQQCRGRQCMCTKAGLRCTSACSCAHFIGCLDSWCKNPNNGSDIDFDS